MDINQFLQECDRVCAVRKISPARLSTILFRDGKRIAAIKAGADVGARRLERARADLQVLAEAGAHRRETSGEASK